MYVICIAVGMLNKRNEILPRGDWLLFLSSPHRYTCSSPEDDAVVLLLLVDGPVVVTGGEGVTTLD